MVSPKRQASTGTATLNAIRSRHETEPASDDPVERRARHLRLCQELIETGMALARAAADRARDDIAAPPPVAAIPGSSAAEIAQAKDEARRRGPDFAKMFSHLARAVRQTMLLETYIAEGRTPALPDSQAVARRPSAPTPPGPHLQHESVRRESLERLDCALPAGPADEPQVERLLLAIAERFGLNAGAPPPDMPHPPSGASPHIAQPARQNGRRW